MNDTSRQILSTNESISTKIAKFCRFTSTFCKILSIKTLSSHSPEIPDSGLGYSVIEQQSADQKSFVYLSYHGKEKRDTGYNIVGCGGELTPDCREIVCRYIRTKRGDGRGRYTFVVRPAQ